MNAEEKDKKLKLMRFWLFGAFAIFFAALTIYFGTIITALGVAANLDISVFRNIYYWILIAVIALVCLGVWYFYKWYLNKK